MPHSTATKPSSTARPPVRGQQAYKARGAALALWKCRDEEILIEGPAGTGKTRGILEKLNYCCMKYSRSRMLIVRKTRESLNETVLVTFESNVLPEGSSVLLGPKRNLRQRYTYLNGSEIIVGGMDNPMKIMSSEYDIIAAFEATELKLDDVESLTTRLRNGRMPYQQFMADCNPGPPQHWLNQRAKTERMTRLVSRHQDNPVLFRDSGGPTHMGEAYLKKLDRLSGHRRSRLFLGKWTAAEGIVYPDFDVEVHVIIPFEIPKAWRKIRSIDFGFNNPFVCQWWAIDPDGDMYLYREIYFSHRTVQDHSKQIKKLSGLETYEVTVSDHDREDRETLHQNDISTVPAFKEIRPGIDAVELRLRKQGPLDRPRLFIFDGCRAELDVDMKDQGLPTNTQEEIDGYTYPKPQDDKAPKEDPVDKDNHGMDAMRYAVAYVDDIQAMKLTILAGEPEAIKVGQFVEDPYI